MTMNEAFNDDLESYKQVLALWNDERLSSTTKFQALLTLNGGLMSAIHFNGGFVAENVSVYSIDGNDDRVDKKHVTH